MLEEWHEFASLIDTNKIEIDDHNYSGLEYPLDFLYRLQMSSQYDHGEGFNLNLNQAEGMTDLINRGG